MRQVPLDVSARQTIADGENQVTIRLRNRTSHIASLNVPRLRRPVAATRLFRRIRRQLRYRVSRRSCRDSRESPEVSGHCGLDQARRYNTRKKQRRFRRTKQHADRLSAFLTRRIQSASAPAMFCVHFLLSLRQADAVTPGMQKEKTQNYVTCCLYQFVNDRAGRFHEPITALLAAAGRPVPGSPNYS